MVDVKDLFLSAFIIVLVAVAATMIGGNNTTGYATKGQTTISVSPTVVPADSRDINVVVNPGQYGSGRIVEIHKWDGDPNVMGDEALGTRVYLKNLCRGNVCKDNATIDFTLSTADYGQYYATVRDCATSITTTSYNCRVFGKWVKAFFTVEKTRVAQSITQRIIVNPINVGG